MHHIFPGHAVLLAPIGVRLGRYSPAAYEHGLQVEDGFGITFNSAVASRSTLPRPDVWGRFIPCHPPQQAVAA